MGVPIPFPAFPVVGGRSHAVALAGVVVFALGLRMVGLPGCFKGFLIGVGIWRLGEPSVEENSGQPAVGEAGVGVCGTLLVCCLFFLLLGAFSGAGGVGRRISGVSGMVFLDTVSLAEELLGGGVSALGLSCAVSQRVILWFSNVLFPGTAILLLEKEQDGRFTSLTVSLGHMLGSEVRSLGDSNAGEAVLGGTGNSTLLTSVVVSFLLLLVS